MSARFILTCLHFLLRNDFFCKKRNIFLRKHLLKKQTLRTFENVWKRIFSDICQLPCFRSAFVVFFVKRNHLIILTINFLQDWLLLKIFSKSYLQFAPLWNINSPKRFQLFVYLFQEIGNFTKMFSVPYILQKSYHKLLTKSTTTNCQHKLF